MKKYSTNALALALASIAANQPEETPPAVVGEFIAGLGKVVIAHKEPNRRQKRASLRRSRSQA